MYLIIIFFKLIFFIFIFFIFIVFFFISFERGKGVGAGEETNISKYVNNIFSTNRTTLISSSLVN